MGPLALFTSVFGRLRPYRNQPPPPPCPSAPGPDVGDESCNRGTEHRGSRRRSWRVQPLGSTPGVFDGTNHVPQSPTILGPVVVSKVESPREGHLTVGPTPHTHRSGSQDGDDVNGERKLVFTVVRHFEDFPPSTTTSQTPLQRPCSRRGGNNFFFFLVMGSFGGPKRLQCPFCVSEKDLRFVVSGTRIPRRGSTVESPPGTQ